jgi:hypothetical protein
MKWLAVIFGVLLLILAFIYWTTPANSLPGFLPGYDASLTTAHHKHAIGAFVLALAAFAYFWFNSKKPSTPKENSAA